MSLLTLRAPPSRAAGDESDSAMPASWSTTRVNDDEEIASVPDLGAPASTAIMMDFRPRQWRRSTPRENR